MDPTSTLQALQAWPIEEQLGFVFRLWDQVVESGWKPELTDDLRIELDSRLAAFEANPGGIRTWDQVVERARKAQ